MDYYLATHTYHSDEKKKEFLKRIKGRMNDMWVNRMNNPKSHFMKKLELFKSF